jgi:uncharacterized membrane protein
MKKRVVKKQYGWRNYIEYLKDNPKGYWFKAKIYGWGWTPVKWQGWVAVLFFILILVLNSIYFEMNIQKDNLSNKLDLTIFLAIIIISVIAIIALGYVKGEKPRWRWGI